MILSRTIHHFCAYERLQKKGIWITSRGEMSLRKLSIWGWGLPLIHRDTVENIKLGRRRGNVETQSRGWGHRIRTQYEVVFYVESFHIHANTSCKRIKSLTKESIHNSYGKESKIELFYSICKETVTFIKYTWCFINPDNHKANEEVL